jgi:uncharacterized membrane protein YuzA (DUF378 family)
MKGLGLWTQIAIVVLVIGGINWGLVGLFSINLLATILGNLFSRLIFIIIGVAAGYMIYKIYLDCTKKGVNTHQ